MAFAPVGKPPEYVYPEAGGIEQLGRLRVGVVIVFPEPGGGVTLTQADPIPVAALTLIFHPACASRIGVTIKQKVIA